MTMSPNCRQAAPAAWDISTVLEALRAIARELPAGPWAVTSAGNVRPCSPMSYAHPHFALQRLERSCNSSHIKERYAS